MEIERDGTANKMLLGLCDCCVLCDGVDDGDSVFFQLDGIIEVGFLY